MDLFHPEGLVSNLTKYLSGYKNCFRTGTRDSGKLPELYISGLLKTESGKRNMERLHEELDMKGDGYQQIQHFITNSPWDARKVIRTAARKTSDLYARQAGYSTADVGYIIDESAHLKKGSGSVGVARQYAGAVGKVDNCQVGVYSSLVWQTHTGLINCRLFLPKCWADDDERCEKAGIPGKKRAHKSKPRLALGMLKADIEAGVRFGWVGGDGLYGHGYELSYAIEDMGLTFLFDVHNNQLIYEREPSIFIPERKPGRGRTPTCHRTDDRPVTVRDYHAKPDESQWEQIGVRDTVKGRLVLSVHVSEVRVWNEKEDHARKRLLIISRNHSENKTKYGLSNAGTASAPPERLAYMQAQRYWVERAFQDAKSELGMSDYQVRKWNGWYHHMALVILALSFIVRERLENKNKYPLLSCRDVRIIIVALLTGDIALIEKRKRQMLHRHRQRFKDIERNFKNKNMTK
ncbi:transposase [Desulfonema ishimotonii]|uniref:Transposase n=1 Tax=Desulfonema ishimotonii TaxID=45657 RepID=A0A401FV71_9BACT|nr:IS701 family transposase [Desulfonema ishimotonii]GBC60877.1 transposase [Desulfonema ishimotonii]